jgi:hypothetical protein
MASSNNHDNHANLSYLFLHMKLRPVVKTSPPAAVSMVEVSEISEFDP